MKFEDFKCAGDAFFWLGKQCTNACCAPTSTPAPAPVPLPPELQCRPIVPEAPIDCCAYAVFDTETSGIAADDVVIQFALGLFDEDGKALQFYDRLWKLPPNGKIKKRAFDVHKIGYGKLNRDGMDAKAQMTIVSRMLGKLKARRVPIVAHNASFDVRMLLQTAAAHGVANWALDTEETFCTMRRSRDFVQAKSKKTGRLKMPSNVEAFRFLHDDNEPHFGALHDALTDIKVTSRVYYVGGKQKGWW